MGGSVVVVGGGGVVGGWVVAAAVVPGWPVAEAPVVLDVAALDSVVESALGVSGDRFAAHAVTEISAAAMSTQARRDKED